LFRWRVQFGVAQKKRATLVPVALADDIAAARVLRDLVQLAVYSVGSPNMPS